MLLYGHRVGIIEFICQRHPYTGIHEAVVKMEEGTFETICPICGRKNRLNNKGKFYSDRPLKVVNIDIDKDLLEKWIKTMNTGD